YDTVHQQTLGYVGQPTDADLGHVVDRSWDPPVTLAATVAALQAEGIEVARPVNDQGWGLLTAIALPGGVELGLYQPRHPIPAPPTRARSALDVAPAQFLELAAVLWLAG